MMLVRLATLLSLIHLCTTMPTVPNQAEEECDPVVPPRLDEGCDFIYKKDPQTLCPFIFVQCTGKEEKLKSTFGENVPKELIKTETDPDKSETEEDENYEAALPQTDSIEAELLNSQIILPASIPEYPTESNLSSAKDIDEAEEPQKEEKIATLAVEITIEDEPSTLKEGITQIKEDQEESTPADGETTFPDESDASEIQNATESESEEQTTSENKESIIKEEKISDENITEEAEEDKQAAVEETDLQEEALALAIDGYTTSELEGDQPADTEQPSSEQQEPIKADDKILAENASSEPEPEKEQPAASEIDDKKATQSEENIIIMKESPPIVDESTDGNGELSLAGGETIAELPKEETSKLDDKKASQNEENIIIMKESPPIVDESTDGNGELSLAGSETIAELPKEETSKLDDKKASENKESIIMGKESLPAADEPIDGSELPSLAGDEIVAELPNNGTHENISLEDSAENGSIDLANSTFEEYPEKKAGKEETPEDTLPPMKSSESEKDSTDSITPSDSDLEEAPAALQIKETLEGENNSTNISEQEQPAAEKQALSAEEMKISKLAEIDASSDLAPEIENSDTILSKEEMRPALETAPKDNLPAEESTTPTEKDNEEKEIDTNDTNAHTGSEPLKNKAKEGASVAPDNVVESSYASGEKTQQKPLAFSAPDIGDNMEKKLVSEITTDEKIIGKAINDSVEIRIQGGPTLNGSGTDAHPYCCYWAELGECYKNPYWMRIECQKSCGTPGCQIKEAPYCKVNVSKDKCLPVDKIHAPESDKCEDDHELCSFWAKKGSCSEYIGYMTAYCCKSCKEIQNKETQSKDLQSKKPLSTEGQVKGSSSS